MNITENFFSWINEHLQDNPEVLRLKYSRKNDGFDYDAAITQIECRRKYVTKLSSTLSNFPNFYFPSILAGEQSTSDLLADYHAGIITEGCTVADLTSGLGIDVFHFARKAKEVYAVEIDEKRAEALRYNAEGLGFDNIHIFEGDCRDFIEKCISDGRSFDFVFIDPARRSDDGKRVYALSDCQPDVVELLPRIVRICSTLVIKASPMLDISHCIKTLGDATKTVTALGTKTECKELVIELDFKESTEVPEIRAVTITPEQTYTLTFTQNEEAAIEFDNCAKAIVAGNYIYEPFPAVLKSGAFNVLAKRYGLSRFNPNTKIFYSDKIEADFPGNIYKVLEILPYASKVIKRLNKTYPVAAIATRNFGLSAEALRSKLKIKDGDEVRIYGYGDKSDTKMLAVTEKVELKKVS